MIASTESPKFKSTEQPTTLSTANLEVLGNQLLWYTGSSTHAISTTILGNKSSYIILVGLPNLPTTPSWLGYGHRREANDPRKTAETLPYFHILLLLILIGRLLAANHPQLHRCQSPIAITCFWSFGHEPPTPFHS